MLSPSPEFEEWRKRVKYVVFDEVHSIGDLASGEIWEHLLSMVDCPFLALSATISNPDDFKQWMETKVKLQETHAKKRGLADARFYDLTLIAHHNRYADLEKSNYVPMVINEAGSPTMPLSSVWDAPEAPTGQLFRLHPCVSLSSVCDDLILL
jgi:superfamily II RNA helicase